MAMTGFPGEHAVTVNRMLLSPRNRHRFGSTAWWPRELSEQRRGCDPTRRDGDDQRPASTPLVDEHGEVAVVMSPQLPSVFCPSLSVRSQTGDPHPPRADEVLPHPPVSATTVPSGRQWSCSPSRRGFAQAAMSRMRVAPQESRSLLPPPNACDEGILPLQLTVRDSPLARLSKALR
jgi:hypothetical protein